MKKMFHFFVVLALCFSMAACGSSGRADDALVGKYIPVTATALGLTLYGDEISDIADFSIELKSGGKAILEVDGTSGKGKWINDDTTITLTVEGVDMVGQIGEDTITFESFLEEMVGTTIDMTFAKEGTDAANPDNYLPQE